LYLRNANSGQLLTMAVAFSAALAQGQDQDQLARLGAFFTIVGDTLSLYALGPNRPNTSRRESAALSLGETL